MSDTYEAIKRFISKMKVTYSPFSKKILAFFPDGEGQETTLNITEDAVQAVAEFLYEADPENFGWRVEIGKDVYSLKLEQIYQDTPDRRY